MSPEFDPEDLPTEIKNTKTPEEFIKEILDTIDPVHTEKPVCKDGYFVKELEFNTKPIYCFPCPEFCETCTETACLTCSKVEDREVREVKEGACICVESLDAVGDSCLEPCADN